MKKIQKILPQALNDELIRLGVAQNAMRRWDEVVGPMLAARSWPDRFDHGVLWVAVAGSAWAQELRLKKTTILARLGEIAGQPHLFSDIRFGVRTLPAREAEELLEIPEEAPVEPKELSIKEIASRRLGKWRDVNPN
jgi:predicted nucleic acid-binding Zn ribbon protein